MNFSIDRDLLLENSNLVQRGLPVKTALPVLNGIKMELTNNSLSLTTSNADISIKVVIEGEGLEIVEPGKIVVPGNYFCQIIRKIESKMVEFSLIEDKILLIKADRSEFKLNLLSYYDYPAIDFACGSNKLDLSAKTIRSIIKETAYATSTSEKRPILTGVHLQSNENEIKAVATDAIRLSQKIVKVENDANLDFVVPFKSFDELLKALEGFNDNVSLSFNKTKAVFAFKNILFQTRLLEGQYPDTSRLIPTTFPIVAKFNKEDFISALDRVSLLSSKDKDSLYTVVRFVINEEHVVSISSSSSEVGNAVEEIVTTEPIEGSGIKVAFSARYMLEALKSFNSPEVEICFTGETRPFIIKGEMDENLTSLILPLPVEW